MSRGRFPKCAGSPLVYIGSGVVVAACGLVALVLFGVGDSEGLVDWEAAVAAVPQETALRTQPGGHVYAERVPVHARSARASPESDPATADSTFPFKIDLMGRVAGPEDYPRFHVFQHGKHPNDPGMERSVRLGEVTLLPRGDYVVVCRNRRVATALGWESPSRKVVVDGPTELTLRSSEGMTYLAIRVKAGSGVYEGPASFRFTDGVERWRVEHKGLREGHFGAWLARDSRTTIVVEIPGLGRAETAVEPSRVRAVEVVVE